MANMYINNMTALWNSPGTFYSAIKMDVNDAAYQTVPDVSRLLDLQAGSVEKFYVDVNGDTYAAGGIITAGAVSAGGGVLPATDGVPSLGSLSFKWNGAFFSSGSVLNWGSGDVLLTHSANALTWTGATTYTFDGTLVASAYTVVATDAAANLILRRSDTVSPVAAQSVGSVTYQGETTTGANVSYAQMGGYCTDPTNASYDGALFFATAEAGGAVATRAWIDGTGIYPGSDGLIPLGKAGTGFSDAYIASLGKIDWGNGNVILDHTTGVLTVAPGDLRVTTPGVDATSIVTLGAAQTLTNKTLSGAALTNPGISGTVTGGATYTAPTINGGTISDVASFSTIDSTVTLGPTTTGTTMSIVRPIQDGVTVLDGGTDTSTGSYVQLFGSSHASNAGDIILGATSSYRYFYDYSAATHYWANASVQLMNLNATGLTVLGGLSAAGGHIVMGAGGSGRYMQFESNYYWDFHTTTKLLRWIRNGVEEFHIGDSGISTTARVFSEAGYYVATGTSGVFACTGTAGEGILYLRPRGMDSATNQCRLFATNGNFEAPGFAESSDETLKRDWTPATKSIVNEVAALEVGSFKWKNTGAAGYGIKAQALRTFMPEAVFEDEDGLLSISYSKAAMAAVIDASKRIVALEAIIEALTAKVAALEAGA